MYNTFTNEEIIKSLLLKQTLENDGREFKFIRALPDKCNPWLYVEYYEVDKFHYHRFIYNEEIGLKPVSALQSLIFLPTGTTAYTDEDVTVNGHGWESTNDRASLSIKSTFGYRHICRLTFNKNTGEFTQIV